MKSKHGDKRKRAIETEIRQKENAIKGEKGFVEMLQRELSQLECKALNSNSMGYLDLMQLTNDIRRKRKQVETSLKNIDKMQTSLEVFRSGYEWLKK